MARVTFSPTTASIDPAILKAESTTAKVCFNPKEIYVNAIIRPIGSGDDWEVDLEYIPRQVNVSQNEVNAVLFLAKGELGRILGSVELGRIQE